MLRGPLLVCTLLVTQHMARLIAPFVELKELVVPASPCHMARKVSRVTS
jgi:hypothetical protein